MKHKEATEYAAKTNKACNGMTAEVVRICASPHLDPIVEGDDGWDVEITVEEDA